MIDILYKDQGPRREGLDIEDVDAPMMEAPNFHIIKLEAEFPASGKMIIKRSKDGFLKS